MREEISSKLEQLGKYIRILKTYQNRTLADLNEDFTLRGAVERYLGLALQCSLDIGEMIISMEKLRKPDTYRDVIEILGENGILPRDFAKRFALAAGFRNILIHMYADIDMEEVHQFLQENLGDFDEFARSIAEHLVIKAENPPVFKPGM
ncbi:MAG: DUF86 domain-containing protein [Candidatus Thermoplasmatota archaeon]|nr:DUF86 domain-containing protein [Euryarchaeota archaeon]MBU4031956.1 DUF86 domain-containing protein [Candidatus Thermoplasmatota archaeon]MBU4592839.1 DUF86 domain-containing protein [Candidatus Thermoplasmatota archaeon]